MRASVDEAIAAGALGFSRSRTLRHRVPDGRFVPGTFAGHDELMLVADVAAPARPRRDRVRAALRRRRPGRAARRDPSWPGCARSAAHERPSGHVQPLADARAGRALPARDRARARRPNAADGTPIRPQTTRTCVGVLLGSRSRTPVRPHAARGARSRDLPLAERLAALRDPQRRASWSRTSREPAGSRWARWTRSSCSTDDGRDPLRLPPRERARRGRRDARRHAGRGVHRPVRSRPTAGSCCSWPLLNQDARRDRGDAHERRRADGPRRRRRARRPDHRREPADLLPLPTGCASAACCRSRRRSAG